MRTLNQRQYPSSSSARQTQRGTADREPAASSYTTPRYRAHERAVAAIVFAHGTGLFASISSQMRTFARAKISTCAGSAPAYAGSLAAHTSACRALCPRAMTRKSQNAGSTTGPPTGTRACLVHVQVNRARRWHAFHGMPGTRKRLIVTSETSLGRNVLKSSTACSGVVR